ncbi:SCO0607 family lipoprotein [Streptomyces sp. NPDC004266]|uniref:SCO0607 family lipoprotein n=1 Tax=Streptomyces sp. NPDC004266 TaxID=3364693 RepID=UPI00367D3BF3
MTTQQTRRPRPRPRTTGGAFARRSLPGLVAAGLTSALLLTGCGFQIHDRVCSPGQYPVKAVGNATGGDCVADGQEPPEGWVRYPAGQVPEWVDDEWDRHWSTTVFDAEGRVVRD